MMPQPPGADFAMDWRVAAMMFGVWCLIIGVVNLWVETENWRKRREARREYQQALARRGEHAWPN